jgi:hypothetical protein
MITYRLIPLSSRSISLDSTFEELKVYEKLKEHAVYLLTDRNMQCNFLQTGTCSVTSYGQEYEV